MPILCLSAGTAHLPQLLSADGLPIWESTACAAYILSTANNNNNSSDNNSTATKTKTIDIPPESIYVETSSYDTIGNAFFARTTHTEFKDWRKLLIITNEFHMDRTIRIFDWIFSFPPTDGAATSTSTDLSLLYDLYYLESPNAGLTSEAIQARKKREATSLLRVDQLSEDKKSLRDVHEFLTQDHALYTSKHLIERGRDIGGNSVGDTVKLSYGSLG